MLFVSFFGTALMKHQPRLGCNPVPGDLSVAKPAVVDKIIKRVFRLAENRTPSSSMKTSVTAAGSQDFLSLAPPLTEARCCNASHAQAEMSLRARRHATTLRGNPVIACLLMLILRYFVLLASWRMMPAKHHRHKLESNQGMDGRAKSNLTQVLLADQTQAFI
ncbi:hypothetical protein GN244_ATG00169 [Phytophthora infestans]|uniref:Uncharacterized protein n=1 Tax=Phytophthora infestans TaxID=4787 RepID=A0A833SX19_PHYIN|nr:hypothetical protein GN244_ATG00169 [Phytophthora infestans]KAF4150413.1 hypothetical protein GN958_ATG00396 [Phytophthora infestans]